jgi:hypothetical protein
VFGDTMSGRLVLAAGSDGGIAFPNDAYGGGGDTASITLETAGGEATRMRFKIENDADDIFEFTAPNNNGLTMNGNVVWHAGNDGAGSNLDADLLDGINSDGFWQQSGNWIADLGDNGFTRRNGTHVDGGEFVVASKDNKGYTLIDGSYYAYEAGGFYSSFNSNYSTLLGFYADTISSVSFNSNIKVPNGSVIAKYTADQSQTFLDQDVTTAAFYTESTQSGSSYVPLAKIKTTGTSRTRSISFGALHNNDNTIDGTIHAINSDNTNHYYWLFKHDGSFYSQGDIVAFSDARLKTNITPIDNALDKVNQLTGVTFNRIDGGYDQRYTGLIAQEVEKVLPEAVVYNNDEQNTMGVAYGNMVGLLIQSIKELSNKVDSLEQQLAAKQDKN